MNRKQQALAAAILIVLLALFGVGRSASAHANVIRSIPANGDTLAVPPSVVIAWFDELPQPGASSLSVYDETLTQIDLKNSTVAAQDPHQMSVGLPPNLPHGTYTVRWTAVSAVDGHHTSGAFAFGVGVTSTTSAAVTPAAPLNPVDALIRWINILALTTISGVLLSGYLVLRTTLPALPIRLLGRLLALGALLGLVGTAADLLSGGLTNLFQTRYDLILLVRAGLIILLLVGLVTQRKQTELSRRNWLAGLVLSGTLLLTLSANSHNAAAALWPALSLAVDWVHLVAVGVWIGGLFVLGLVLKSVTAADRRAILIPFSALATTSVAALSLTGLYSAGLQLTLLSDLWTSDYGRWLLIKLALVGALLLLGLFNNRALAAKRPSDQALVQVQRRVLIEAFLGIVVLFVVGLLTATPPPVPPDPPADRTLTQTQTEGDLTASLRVAPNVPGPNTLTATVRLNDQPLTSAKRVRARFILADIGLQSDWLTLAPDTNGHYTASSTDLSAVGEWRIQLDVNIDDVRDEVRLVFPWTESSGRVGRQLAQPRPINTLALGLLSMAAVLLVGTRALNAVRRYGKRGERALIGGLGALIGVWLLITLTANALQNRGDLPTVNTIPPNTASIEQGQAVYQQVCLACHGPQGLGDGPNAPALPVPPANLRTHIALHSDADLFRIMTQGSGAMPPVAANLTVDQRWNLINYLRTIEADSVSQ